MVPLGRWKGTQPLLDLVISCVFVFGRRMSGQDMAYSAYNHYRGRPCRPLHTSLSGNNLNCRRNYVCQSVVLLYSDQQIPDPPSRPLSLPACCCCTNHYRLLLLIQSCMACQGQGHWLVVSTTVRSRSSPRRRHSFVEWRIAGVDDRETETDRNALGTCWSAICHELRKLT